MAWLVSASPALAIRPASVAVRPNPRSCRMAGTNDPWEFAITFSCEFSGDPARFSPRKSALVAEKSRIGAATPNTKADHRGSMHLMLSAKSLLAPNRGARRSAIGALCLAEQRRFRTLQRLSKALKPLAFTARSRRFHPSHNSTHPSAKELVFFVSRLGVTTHERTELRLWRGLP
jgi:hypothetical protein